MQNPKRLITLFQAKKIKTPFFVVPLLIIFYAGSYVNCRADWTNLGQVNGIQVYRDNSTGLEWTVTIGQVQSSGWGAPARALVQRYGFRLPSFNELQVMEANGGSGILKIRNTLGQYYETSNSNILGAAWGNGFRTPQQRTGNGKNWVIGVRRPQSGGNQNSGNTVIQQTPPTNQNQVFPQGGDSQGPKVHMIFVWGTKASDTYWSTMISKKKIEKAFSDCGLGPNSSYVGTYITLEGDQATADSIRRTCYSISAKAGPNDAVLVYILCHGASFIKDGDPSRTKYHALSPVCADAKNLNMQSIGIQRSTIMEAIKSNQHRLDMLITDACTPLTMEVPPGFFEPSEAPGTRSRQKSVSKLFQLLISASGTLNINSCNPDSGSMNEGERAMGCEPDLDEKSASLTTAMYTENSGTVFTNAFIKTASTKIPPNQYYSTDQFFLELKQYLNNQYKSTKQWAINSNIAGLEIFMSQQTQTLTHYNDNGIAMK